MVQTRIVHYPTCPDDLLYTYSDENFKLLQNETNKILDYPATDVIVGYKDGKPVGKYTYTETDIPIDIDPAPIDEVIQQKAEAFDYLTGRSGGNE